VKQMQTQQMVMPGDPQYSELGTMTYGMGFFVTTYQGHKLVDHGGNIDGFSALVSFMPKDNMGMVILTNANGSPVPTIVARNVYDRLLGVEQVEWTKRSKEAEAKAKASAEEAKAKKLTTQRANTKPSHDTADYLGDFEHPAYGVVKIAKAGDGMTMTYCGMTAPLSHFHYDVFETGEVDRNPFSKQKLQFQTSVQGDIASVSWAIDSNVKEIVFTRRGDSTMRNRRVVAVTGGSPWIYVLYIPCAASGAIRRYCLSRATPLSRNFPTKLVSYFPRTKSGSRMIAWCRGIVVFGPRMMYSESARRIRSIAFCRVVPIAMIFPIIES